MHSLCSAKVTARLLSCAQVPVTMGNSFLMFRSAFCIAASLTTNELIGRGRYGYMKARCPSSACACQSIPPPGWYPHSQVAVQDADGRHHNRFDRGPISNCMQFWEKGWPDWAAAFEEAEQVRFRLPQLLLCICQRLSARELTHGVVHAGPWCAATAPVYHLLPAALRQATATCARAAADSKSIMSATCGCICMARVSPAVRAIIMTADLTAHRAQGLFQQVRVHHAW